MVLLLRLVINGDNEYFFPNLSDLVFHLQTGCWQGKKKGK